MHRKDYSMIFRTITDDSTGATKSIGLFGKPLSKLKGILNSFKQNGVISTLNTPSINIDVHAIDRYNDTIRTGIPYEQALAEARRTTNAETIALIESFNGLEVQTERVTAAQKASTLAAKAHSAALKAASIAGNMILFTAVTKGIELVVKGFDNYIRRVEKAAEKTEEANSRIEEFNSKHKSHADLVEKTAKRYEELSKGINSADNSNISLSDEDYAEFLDISSQLLEAFPELYNGLDENGNAVLKIGTSAQSASEHLQGLIDKEEDINNVKTANELDGLFENVFIQIEDAEKKMFNFEDELTNLDSTWKNAQIMSEGDILGLSQLEIGNDAELQNAVARSIQQLQDELHKQLENNKIDADAYLKFTEQFVNPALYNNGATLFNGYVDLVSLDETQKQRLQEIIHEQTGSLMEELNDSVGDAKNIHKYS